MADPKRPSLWRPEHLKELEEMFPEQARPSELADANFRQGQRSVVLFLRAQLARYVDN